MLAHSGSRAAVLAIALGAAIPAAAVSVQLSPAVDAPSAVGTLVTWTAAPDVESDTGPANVWYRFRVRRIGEDARMMRDYSPQATIDWVAMTEGDYEIEATAKDMDTGEESLTSTLYHVDSRVLGDTPVLTPMDNPLVVLYSAPPCDPGSRMRVETRSPEGVVQTTNYQQCRAGTSMNFVLAGMRASTTYSVTHRIDTGSSFIIGPEVPLTAGSLSRDFPVYRVVQGSPAPAGILLHGNLSQNVVATDLSGNILWYYPGYLSFFTAPEPGGLFLGLVQDYTADASAQRLVEFDLAGVTTRETNTANINHQLQAMGKRPITAFHHDARRLPDGKIVTIGSTEQILTDVQGPGDVDVLGDMILVLDQDLQVVWTWDAFDHLDPYQTAVLGEKCAKGAGGCPPFYLAASANDWLHSNSVQFTPDGNLLLSMRHQDLVVKIDYRNGSGGGDILWRLGKGGDFQMTSSDPSPWFSHQHDPGFLANDNSSIVVFDNGNTRRAADPQAHSRGQVIRIDERNRTATLVLNADLGAYSLALGSADMLPSGNFHFEVGWIAGGAGQPNTSRSVEVDASGNIVYAIESAAEVYRSYRTSNLYTR